MFDFLAKRLLPIVFAIVLLVYALRGFSEGSKKKHETEEEKTINYEIISERALILHEKKEYRKAISEYTKLINSNSWLMSWALLQRGDCLYVLRDYNGALSDYKKTIRLNPKNQDAHNSLAWLLATCPDSIYRDGAAAIIHAKKSLELMETISKEIKGDRLDTLAAAHAEAGQFGKAVELQKEAIILKWGYPPLEQRILGNDKPQKPKKSIEQHEFENRLNFYINEMPFRDFALINQTVDLGDGVKLDMVLIPVGKFLMGSPETEEGRHIIETQHEVIITKTFFIGSTEITQAQWQKVMGNNPSKFKGDELPVEEVSWEEAVEFCRRLSEKPEEKKAGRKYRLPTEAEWEYACRAGTTTPFHFGSQLNGRQANCNGTAPYGTDKKGPHLKKASPVGTYPPNAWGLYDMHGNVCEWCSDWAGEYPAGSVTDPNGPATGSDRVVRGCSWFSAAVDCRSAYRVVSAPSNRNRGLGFRVALSSSEIPK